MTTIRIKTHPGEILKLEFMVPLGLSARAVAEAIGIPPNRLTAIISGRRSVTADTTLRLGGFFRTTAELWTNLQSSYDLSLERAAPGVERVLAAPLEVGEHLTLEKVLEALPADRRQAIAQRAAQHVAMERKRQKNAPATGRRR